MKKIAYLVLALVMLLPMIVACGGGGGTLVEVKNVVIVSYKDAYSETATGDKPVPDETLKAEIYSGALKVTVEEGKTLTVKDVVDAYANDIDGAAVYDEDTNTYKKLADLSEGNGWFWNYKVNGVDASLNTEIKVEDAIIISYEK
jgi:hypothetical protein